ncbi:MAG: hypothetical protein H3C35_06075 [Bacteroidetes bacterium]|nr:hypothetical protein [Bacteroidota bacterium]
MKEFVFDLLYSKFVAENPMYDYGVIKNAVESYYAGNLLQAHTINWWLTFELWRQNIEGK